MPEAEPTRDPENQIVVWDEEIQRLRNATEIEDRDRLAWELTSKGELLRGLGRHEEAISVFDEVIARLDGAVEPELRLRVAVALGLKGTELDNLQRPDESLAVFDDWLSRFGDSTDEAMGVHVAFALSRKGAMLVRLNRLEDAFGAFDDLLRRFRDTSEPAIRDYLGSALYNKGLSLGRQKHREAAIAAYDEMLEVYDSDPLRVARALNAKGRLLWKLHRWEEAGKAYGEIVTRFATSTEPQLQKYVPHALQWQGGCLFVAGRDDEALAALDDLAARLGGTLPLRGRIGMGCLRSAITADRLVRRAAPLTRRAKRRRRS